METDESNIYLRRELHSCLRELLELLKTSDPLGSNVLQEWEQRFSALTLAEDKILWVSLISPKPYLRVSGAFAHVWGLDLAELYHNPWLWVNSIHPHDRQKVECAFSSWLQENSHKRCFLTYRIIRPDGEVRTLEDQVSGVFAAKGKLSGSCGLVQDITRHWVNPSDREESHQGVPTVAFNPFLHHRMIR